MKSISKNKVLIIGVIVPCIAHMLIGLVSSEWSQATLFGFDVDDPEVFGDEESLARFERRIILPNDTDYNPNATVKEMNAAYFTAKARNSTTPAPPGVTGASTAGTEATTTEGGEGASAGSVAPGGGSTTTAAPPAEGTPAPA